MKVPKVSTGQGGKVDVTIMLYNFLANVGGTIVGYFAGNKFIRYVNQNENIATFSTRASRKEEREQLKH